MRRALAVTTAIAALGLGASLATAKPTAFDKGEKLCTQFGGTFTTDSVRYNCDSGSTAFTNHQIDRAQRLCFKSGAGLFAVTGENLAYQCVF